MGLDRDLIARVRRLDEYELRRLLILARGLLVHADGQPGSSESGLPQGLRYRRQSVNCGKESCSRCPHGPYWYAFWKEGGRTRKRYIGRHLPGEPAEAVVPDLPGTTRAGGQTPAGDPRADADREPRTDVSHEPRTDVSHEPR